METEKRDLERQANEQKAKCEATEKREIERRLVEEKKHNEEIQFLKRTNQQLKVGPPKPPPRQAQVEGLLPAAPHHHAGARRRLRFLQRIQRTCPHVLPRSKGS